MATLIVMANTKGGSGKTTASLVLGGEILSARGRVVFLEGDKNRALAKWATHRDAPMIDIGEHRIKTSVEARAIIDAKAGASKCVVVTTNGDEKVLFEWLEGALGWAHFVIADPEGTANQWLVSVASQANLVLIPFAPTAIDAEQVADTILALRRIEKTSHRTIPYRILLTRSNHVATRDEREIRASLVDNGLPVMRTSLKDRPAFRAFHKHYAILSEMTDDQLNGLTGARQNAAAFADEVFSVLRSIHGTAAAA